MTINSISELSPHNVIYQKVLYNTRIRDVNINLYAIKKNLYFN